MSPLARETKPKINKWDYIKPKSFGRMKETVNKMKTEPPESERYLQTMYLNKRLIFKIYKKFIQLNLKKIKQTQAEDLNSDISKRQRHGQQTLTSLN